jgi:hypothetical protein
MRLLCTDTRFIRHSTMITITSNTVPATQSVMTLPIRAAMGTALAIQRSSMLQIRAKNKATASLVVRPTPASRFDAPATVCM